MGLGARDARNFVVQDIKFEVQIMLRASQYFKFISV